MSVNLQYRPVDLGHLGRYTGGDSALNSEVLQLFRNQSLELINRLEAHLHAGETKGWHDVSHALKGAARGIGAFALAEAAAALELVDPQIQHDRAARALQVLKANIQAVTLFIEAYLGR